MLEKYISIKMRVNPVNNTDDIKSTSLFPKKKNVFFIEGGGTKGVYAMGVLNYLYDENVYIKLQDVDIFGGTSVGSILAVGLSLGYQKKDFEKFVETFDLSKFVDSKYYAPFTLYRFLTKGHLYDDTNRQTLVKKILNINIETIRSHLDLPIDSDFEGTDITFWHLKKLIKKYPQIYKHLLINSVDISREQQIFMTTLDDNWDNIKLYDSILASSAFPFVFPSSKFYYNSTTQKYQYQSEIDTNDKITENSFIDGGVANNIPLDYLILNSERFTDCNLWSLQFTTTPAYSKITGPIALIQKLINFAFSYGRKSFGLELIHEKYQVNVINLNLSANTFDTYNNNQIKEITRQIYDQCLSGQLHFDNVDSQ
ncbi:Patatin phospholipase [Acanthamoeba polyphaga mimivirus]|nr:Patatin phospholipase [Acanthamoeba castellanii mamavirus]AHA45224.1 patatin phospholipase [Hirudovirus strain Sangsue]EJN41042.1 hypothetical protein lvs_L539 [Acanthamoeba polyphaga lentillevirus]UMZ07842.1 Patatin phospholipase [Acanthamoeba polyphaga mimivirus]